MAQKITAAQGAAFRHNGTQYPPYGRAFRQLFASARDRQDESDKSNGEAEAARPLISPLAAEPPPDFPPLRRPRHHAAHIIDQQPEISDMQIHRKRCGTDAGRILYDSPRDRAEKARCAFAFLDANPVHRTSAKNLGWIINEEA